MLIAQQYGIYLSEDAELYDLFYLSACAKKQIDSKAKAAEKGLIWIA